MANDADWVEDVRRWYFGGNAPAADAEPATASPAIGDPTELGYETAHPALQARHWPDAPRQPSKSSL
ncbi:MAG: hypothetical protein ABI605_10035 [Rhizobacter sp.]